jgi:hypothetical protein
MVNLYLPKVKNCTALGANDPGQLNWGTNSGNTNQITAPKIKPAQQDAIITIEDFFMTAER